MANGAFSPSRERAHRRAQALAVGCGALLSAVVLARGAGATTVLPTTFSQMCAQADTIFVGTVTEVRSQWADAAARRIETLVTFSDLEILLGAPAPTITLSFAGGRMEDIVESVGDLPTFVVGERVLLFALEGRYVSPIVGFHQGCFRIVESGGEPRVRNAGGQPVKFFEKGLPVVGEARSAAQEGMTLPAFLERIRQELSATHREGGRR
jgi:hypothetical protein